jgi:GTP-binding protein EngB required for normal cell division
MPSELFDECDNDLKTYSKLNPKQKRNLIRNIEDLFESNLDEGKLLFINYFEIFDLDSKFISLKELFIEKYGDITKLRKEKVLPQYLLKLNNLIKKSLTNEEEKTFEIIFNLIVSTEPEAAYNFYDENESKFNSTPFLKNLITLNWNILKKYDKPFEIGKDFIPIYKIRNIQIYHKEGFIYNKEYIHGDIFSSEDERKSINLLVVGETGTGKTTLLNSMVNYLLGIKYNDPLRIKMIIENATSDAHSITSSVNLYQIKPKKKIFPFPVRFIDTPGFGDTGGLKVDKENTKKLWKFLTNECPDLHGICFVMKASTTRLTAIQQYISQQILGIFGKDTVNNFLGLLTYSDNKTPKALDAIKEGNLPISNDKIFKFNNSAIFPDEKDDSSEESITKFFWQMGYQSFDKFFSKMKIIKPVSLKMTKEVISARKNLETKVETLRAYIQLGLDNLSKLRNNLSILNDNFNEIITNKNYKFTMEKIEKRTVPTGVCNTWCTSCQYYCHYPCYLSPNDDKNDCSAISGGKCTVCRDRCPTNTHINRIIYKEENIKKTETNIDQNVLNRFNSAKDRAKKVNEIINDLKRDITKTSNDVSEQIEECRDCLEALSKFALKKNTIDIYGYMDQMISIEEEEKKFGYEKRIQQIKEIKKHYEIIIKMDKKEKIFDDDTMNKLIQECEEKQRNTKTYL